MSTGSVPCALSSGCPKKPAIHGDSWYLLCLRFHVNFVMTKRPSSATNTRRAPTSERQARNVVCFYLFFEWQNQSRYGLQLLCHLDHVLVDTSQDRLFRRSHSLVLRTNLPVVWARLIQRCQALFRVLLQEPTREYVHSIPLVNPLTTLRTHVLKERATLAPWLQHDPIACSDHFARRHQWFVQLVHDTELQILYIAILKF